MKTTIIFLVLNVLHFTSALPKTNPNGRIIGGQQARLAEYPFVAAIEARTTDARYFCAGTLINNQWILTAGHCVHEALSFTIHLGATKLDGSQNTRLTLSSSSYVVHPLYKGGTLENDIGLIRLREPITFNEYIKPIDYFPDDHAYEYSPAIAVGWGQTSDNTPGPVNDLNRVDVVIIPNNVCQRTYGNQITDHMVCTVGSYHEGICIDDSGGPLLHQVGREAFMIVGVISFHSFNGCETPEPSGYTRVFTYMDWISNNTNNYVSK